MKKDKEWLKEKVETYFSNWWSNPNTYATHDLMDSVKHLINQLDEPEVLSQEWIDRNKEPFHHFENNKVDYYVSTDFLQNLLIPKKELPAIPRFVADWIEENKKQNKSIVFAICYIYDENKIGGLPAEKENKIFQWMKSSDNDEVFARAWLDGYGVEKEQKYYALVKGHELVNGSEGSYWTVDGDDFYIYNNWYDHSEYKPTKLTKYDWSNLGINEDNADFVKAGDME